MVEKVATYMVPPNIALIKYWGWRDNVLVLPHNSSISMTLRGVSRPLMTVTSAAFSSSINEDVFYLNGKKEKDLSSAKRIADLLRVRAGTTDGVLVATHNSFPHSAGVASSASGGAAAAFASADALQLRLSVKELSIVARQSGSASASRSCLGGFVKLNRGQLADGSDSFSEQVFDENHWPELNDIIVIVSSSPKKVSSREGHQRTVDTSPLYHARPAFAEQGVATVIEGLSKKDFELLGSAVMRDSDDMHATMLDSYPPIHYMTDNSWKIVDFLLEQNSAAGRTVYLYTVDAGPTIHALCLDRDKKALIESLSEMGFTNIIEAKAGPGPKRLGEEYSLIDESTLTPKTIEPNSYFSELQRKL